MMRKTYLLTGLIGTLLATSCSQGSTPAAVLDTPALEVQATKPVKPAPPSRPAPPPPGTPGTGNTNVSVQCVQNAGSSTCTITITGQTQVKTYDGQVSPRVTTGADGKAIVQIVRDGEVIDTITG